MHYNVGGGAGDSQSYEQLTRSPLYDVWVWGMGHLLAPCYSTALRIIVKLRQGSGKDGQGLVNKRPLMAPNGLKGLSTLA